MITVPDDYPSIQTAVGNASSGDTVFVRSGRYLGGIVINKPMSLMGEDANSTIIVGGTTASELGLVSVAQRKTPEIRFLAEETLGLTDGAKQTLSLQTGSAGIQPVNFIPPLTFAVVINSDDVAISGFTIMGGDRAIFSSNGSRLQIRQNALGTCIFGGSNNTIVNNSRIGLTISGFYNLVAGNSGGLTTSSSNSTFVENSLTYFESGNADFNIIANNTLTGANMGMWIGSYGHNCSYNLFAGNKIENAGLWGILMGAGAYNVFFENTVKNTGVGNSHDGYGLALGGTHLTADNNLFLRNIFANNAKNFGANWNVSGVNSFDNGKEGNYWDDYLTRYPNASEVGASGTGDTPYIITGSNIDHHPLLKQPDTSGKVTRLPEPWASLLPAPTVSETAFPNQTLPPTSTPSPTASASQTAPPSTTTFPNTSPSALPPSSPTPPLSPSPSVPEFSSWIVLFVLAITVFAVALLVRKKQLPSW